MIFPRYHRFTTAETWKAASSWRRARFRYEKFLTAIRQAGTPVGVSLVLVAAEGIITSKDRSLLVENGAHISLKRGWTLSLFKRMLYVKRKALKTNTILSDEEFQRRRCTFLHDISGMVSQHNITEEIVLNLGRIWYLLETGRWQKKRKSGSS